MIYLYKHKETGEKLELIKQHGIVGRFELINSEIKKRYMRIGRERIVCLMGDVEESDES